MGAERASEQLPFHLNGNFAPVREEKTVTFDYGGQSYVVECVDLKQALFSDDLVSFSIYPQPEEESEAEETPADEAPPATP